MVSAVWSGLAGPRSWEEDMLGTYWREGRIRLLYPREMPCTAVKDRSIPRKHVIDYAMTTGKHGRDSAAAGIV